MNHGFIRIWSGTETPLELPYPDNDSGLQTIATAVNGAFNGLNQFIGQKVGRDRGKVELSWKVMDAALWQQILQRFNASFVLYVQYYDMAAGVITRSFYVSDRSARPLDFAEDGMTWKTARDCKLNLIDTGRGS